MINEIVYNIPANRVETYRHASLIVRSRTSRELIDSLSSFELGKVRFVQLVDLPNDTSLLEAWGKGIPIDIVLSEPAAEFPLLYNYPPLLDSHPVRVSIPVRPGFSKAVKLAVSLNFAVKLEIDQPDEPLIDELMSVLDLYLHRPDVRQPIEFFHSILFSFHHQESASLWQIAEEDPANVRYITDDGQQALSRKSAGIPDIVLDGFVERFSKALIVEKSECDGCEFFNCCRGYFKWPDKSYECSGVKKVFATLKTSAAELAEDLASFDRLEVAQKS